MVYHAKAGINYKLPETIRITFYIKIKIASPSAAPNEWLHKFIELDGNKQYHNRSLCPLYPYIHIPSIH